jgi:hypothetical protein
MQFTKLNVECWDPQKWTWNVTSRWLRSTKWTCHATHRCTERVMRLTDAIHQTEHVMQLTDAIHQTEHVMQLTDGWDSHENAFLYFFGNFNHIPHFVFFDILIVSHILYFFGNFNRIQENVFCIWNFNRTYPSQIADIQSLTLFLRPPAWVTHTRQFYLPVGRTNLDSAMTCS